GPARRASGPGRAAASAVSAGARVLPLPQRLEFPRLGEVTQGLLDRLLRGRAWVVLIGVLLVGIVFFNVDVLRLNRSIASTSARATALKQENARLLLEEASLASSDRIQQAAAADGMVLPAPGEVRYLRARPGDALRASRVMTSPQPVPPPAATPQTVQPAGTAPAPAGANGTTGPTATTTPTTTPTTTTPTTGTGTTGAGGTQTTTPPPDTQQPATTGGVTP
ncbi:MAG TPA: cell division protein FtsL, partial [Thermoleophilaceae bacterium]|nr:cell division protein FtsL [Thermoleophilaceae bacterium]